MNPFECDLCIFHKLKGRDPNSNSELDKLLMKYIRQMNLDVFWSRASQTVRGNKTQVNGILEESKFFGLNGPFIHAGPFPDYDHCGYEVAIAMLRKSMRPGKNNLSHQQFDTIRSYPTAYGNHVRVTPQACSRLLGLVDVKGIYRWFSDDPCSLLWFQRFKEGCKRRMGSDWRPNQAMSTELVVEVLRWMDGRQDTGSHWKCGDK